MTWGTPGSAPDDPTDVEHPIVPGGQSEGLTAGDEAEQPEPAEQQQVVDAHLIQVRPTPRQRLAGIAQGELEKPAWVEHPSVLWEMVERAQHVVIRAAWAGMLAVPKVAPRATWWALRGAGRVVAGVTSWCWDGDMHPSWGTVQATDEAKMLAMAKMRQRRQQFRLAAVGVALVLALVVGVSLWSWHRLAAVVAAVLAAAVLVRIGRPEGERLLSPVVSAHVQPRLTAQGIIRALAATGLSPLVKLTDGKTDTAKLWRSQIAAVPGGYKVWLQLPYGVVAEELVKHEQRLAHALGRPEDCVIVSPKPQVTPGDLVLHVFDRPQLTSDIGPGPLATARKTSWWDPVQVGKTRLGKSHPELLRGGAWFVGGRPASGKSSLCRIAAAHTALDPTAILIVVNLKGSPDYVALQPICHRYLAGSPETNPDIIPATIDLLRWVLGECARRNDLLVDLVRAGKAESADVTPELAQAHDELRPMTVILDEVHRLFDTSDNPEAAAAAELLAKVIKAVRSAGITLICATQLAGTESVPPVVTRAARLRGCLVVSDSTSFRQIYGDAGKGAFAAAGVSRFRPGTVLLASETGAPLKVGCHNTTPAVLAQIGQRALAARERLHLLTGEAAGEQFEVAEREDPTLLLRDVLAAIPAAEPAGGTRDAGVAWVAELEVDLEPDRAAGWLAAELRARGVRITKSVGRTGERWGPKGKRTEQGVEARAVRDALAHLDSVAEAAEPVLQVVS